MRGLYGTGVKGIACKKEKEHKKESIRKREKKEDKNSGYSEDTISTDWQMHGAADVFQSCG